MIVSLQVQKGKRVETYLRSVTSDDKVETVRKIVTAMLAHPQDFTIGNQKRSPYAKAKKRQPAIREDEIPGVVSNAAEREACEQTT